MIARFVVRDCREETGTTVNGYRVWQRRFKHIIPKRYMLNRTHIKLRFAI